MIREIKPLKLSKKWDTGRMKCSLEDDMARYKPYQYDQMVLVPLSFQDQLEPGSFEYTLNELVEHHLDLSVFEARYQNDRTGARAIHPKLLLKVILFA